MADNSINIILPSFTTSYNKAYTLRSQKDSLGLRHICHLSWQKTLLNCINLLCTKLLVTLGKRRVSQALSEKPQMKLWLKIKIYLGLLIEALC